jgi:hypothetical protein
MNLQRILAKVVRYLDAASAFLTVGGPRFASQFVGLGECTIKPEDTVILRASACVPMKLLQLVIPFGAGRHLQVNQITINGKETLVNFGPVPGEMFARGASFVSPFADSGMLQPGCCIEISLTNTSKKSVNVLVGGLARLAF